MQEEQSAEVSLASPGIFIKENVPWKIRKSVNPGGTPGLH